MIQGKDNPVANPLIVLREDFDDWAILFDPDSGKGFALNPVSVFIWKCLDGKHTIPDILAELRENCNNNVPENVEDHVKKFIHSLIECGLAGYELQKV